MDAEPRFIPGYEYVAVIWHRHPAIKDECFAREYDRLRNNGWEVLRRAPLSAGRIGGACIMRRPKRRPKDEPRKWTRREIEKIVVMNQPGPRGDGGWLGPPLPGRNPTLKNKEETNG